MPFFSVVIPCYNRAGMVCDAIDSVLAQSFSDFEIIVVDDGSTDNTLEMLSKYKEKIRLTSQSNAGVAAARNKGLSLSNGQYLCYLDSDDIWPETKLEEYMRAIERCPEASFIFSDFCKHNIKLEERFSQSNTDMFPYIHKFTNRVYGDYYLIKKGDNVALLMSGYPLYPSTFAVRRDVHDNFRWDPGILKSEDFNFVLRLSSMHQFLYIDRDLATIRVHDTNKSADFLMKNRVNIVSMKLYRDLYAKNEMKSALNYYISRRIFLDGRLYLSKGLWGKGALQIISSLAYKENLVRLLGKIRSKFRGH